jgi:hypothetical protein
MPAYVQDVATYTTTAGNKTAAITPAVGNLLVVCAGVASLPTLPTIADDRGGTYSLVAWSTRPAGGGSPSGIWVRNQLVASAVLHTVTMSSSGDGGGGLDVLELSGFVVGGLGTVRSWGQRSAINAAAIPDVSLNHTAEPTGLIVAFLTPSDNPATATTPTGYTNRQNLGFNTPVTGMRVETRDSGETTGTITWGAAETSGSNTVAVEFFAGGISEPVPFVPAALPLNRHVRSLIGPPILVEMPDPGTAGATIVTSGSSSDRSMGRQAAAATVFALSGSSSSRGVDRQSAAALVQVNIGSSSARATDRQTGAGVAVVITGSSSSRAVNRQQASSVAIRTASGTDRSRGRQSAASLAIELVSSAARSVGRQAANALSIALGSSQSRARNRENAAATVIVLAGSSSARSGSRTAANSSVVAPGAVTVEAPTMQPLAIRQRIGLGPILVTEQNDTGATPAAAAIVVSGSSSSRASSRSTGSSLVQVNIGSSPTRAMSRQRASSTVTVTSGQSLARVQGRARAQALAIVSALSSSNRSRGRESAVALAVAAGGPTGRELASAAVSGGLGSRGSGAEIGSRSIPGDRNARQNERRRRNRLSRRDGRLRLEKGLGERMDRILRGPGATIELRNYNAAGDLVDAGVGNGTVVVKDSAGATVGGITCRDARLDRHLHGRDPVEPLPCSTNTP